MVEENIAEKTDAQPSSRGQQVMAQWIVSLAISVVCCAVLFLVFAGYIMDLHKSVALATVRIEALQDSQGRLANNLDAIRRSSAPIVQINGATVTTQEPGAQPVVQSPEPAIVAAPAQNEGTPKATGEEAPVSPVAKNAPVVVEAPKVEAPKVEAVPSKDAGKKGEANKPKL